MTPSIPPSGLPNLLQPTFIPKTGPNFGCSQTPAVQFGASDSFRPRAASDTEAPDGNADTGKIKNLATKALDVAKKYAKPAAEIAGGALLAFSGLPMHLLGMVIPVVPNLIAMGLHIAGFGLTGLGLLHAFKKFKES